MAVLAVMNPLEARSYVILNFVGNFSLFPLLHEDRETVIKVFLLFFNHVITITSLQHKRRSKKHTQSVTCLQYCYLIMCVPLFFLCRYFYLISETLEKSSGVSCQNLHVVKPISLNSCFKMSI